MNNKFDQFGRLCNPCVQIDTSISSLVREDIDVTTSDMEPQFMDENDDPLDIYKAQDPLYWYKFDPFSVQKDRERDQQNATSSESAKNINPAFID